MIGTYTIFVDGVDITDKIGRIGNKITYRDNMGLVSDTLDIALNDSSLESKALFPNASKLEAEFEDENGKVLKTGALYVDTYSGRISGAKNLDVGANSKPSKTPGLSKFVSYNKKKVKLKTLLTDVLKKGDLGLVYRFNKTPIEPWDIELSNVTIQDQTIASVVSTYRDLFGCMLKIYDDSIVFTNKQAFDLDPVIKTLVPYVDQIENFDFDINEHQDAEYEMRYYNPRTGKITQDKRSKQSILLTESETIKQIIANISDPDTAQAVAMAVDGQRQATTTFETDGAADWIAGGVYELTDIVELSGKYVITSAYHMIDKEWLTELSGENIF